MQAHHGPVQPEALVPKKATECFTRTESCRLFHFAGHVSLVAETSTRSQVGLVKCIVWMDVPLGDHHAKLFQADEAPQLPNRRARCLLD